MHGRPPSPPPPKGLDEAILGFSAGTDPEADTARITQLLRHGAHSLAAQDEKSAVADEFAREDIDQVRARLGC